MGYSVYTQVGQSGKATPVATSGTFLEAVTKACVVAEGMENPTQNSIVSVRSSGANFHQFSVKWVLGRGWIPNT